MYHIKTFLFFLPLTALPLFSQTANLSGRVVDESGAVVPSARVTLSTSSAPARNVSSDIKGNYEFRALPPGAYSIQASAPDLAAAPAAITLKPGAQTYEITLRIVASSQEVTVQDTAGPRVTIDSSNNAGALVLRGEDLDALSDDPDDLAADLSALAGPSAGPNGGAIFVDGFSGGEIPPKESIREIRINQNPFSPEFDKLGYGRIEIFTKPGADKYRATVDYNLGTEWWNTRNPYSAVKAPFLLNEFEGSAGGPINKRTSFTVEAQRNMVDNGSISNAVVVDPQTFAVQSIAGAVTSPQRYTRITPRVDYQLNEHNTLMFRYGITHATIQDAGIGGLNLPSVASHTQYTNQTAQFTETAVLGASAIHETRFQFFRSSIDNTANGNDPAIRVLGSFNGGSSTLGRSSDIQNNFELQDYTSLSRGTHFMRFGVRLRGQMDNNIAPQNFNGTFTFGGGVLGPVLDANNQPVLDTSGQPVLATISSIERYRRTLLFQKLGYSAAQIRALGGGATQFTVNAGLPSLAVHQMDWGFFFGDEWRLRPNFTLSLGLRYEGQTNIHDHGDLAPRVALAWAPGAKNGNQRAKTVFRAGFGMFYDRFALANTLTAFRFNGLVQQQYAVANPDFFPVVPLTAALATYQSSQIEERVSSTLRAPYIIQSAATIERQLRPGTTLAVSFTNSHGLHMLRSRDINAPLPGTYNPSAPSAAVYPLGNPGPVFLMESSGIYNQNQLIANVNSKVSSAISLFGFYVLNRAMSNTDGIGTFPANPYSSRGEYGPAITDVRNRVTVGGSLTLRWAIRISPFLIMQSGAPFDITSGSDPYGTTLFNARPGIATAGTPGAIHTSYGWLDPNPSPGETLVSRNFGRGPALLTMNLRIAKSIGFGERKERPKQDLPNASANADAASGRGLGRVLGSPPSGHRYTLTFGMSIRNLLNHTNPGPIIGDITSPLFGLSTQIAGTPNGEGFFETANNRRLESQIRLTF